jgi:hypothetical protein
VAVQVAVGEERGEGAGVARSDEASGDGEDEEVAAGDEQRDASGPGARLCGSRLRHGVQSRVDPQERVEDEPPRVDSDGLDREVDEHGEYLGVDDDGTHE